MKSFIVWKKKKTPLNLLLLKVFILFNCVKKKIHYNSNQFYTDKFYNENESYIKYHFTFKNRSFSFWYKGERHHCNVQRNESKTITRFSVCFFFFFKFNLMDILACVCRPNKITDPVHLSPPLFVGKIYGSFLYHKNKGGPTSASH
jgi:hypothetical protein